LKIGAAYLLAADIAAQHVLPVALPVGAVTAGLVTPYFLVLLWRGHARLRSRPRRVKNNLASDSRFCYERGVDPPGRF